MVFMLHREKSEIKLPFCQGLCVKFAGNNVRPISQTVPDLEILCKFRQSLIIDVDALSKAVLISGVRGTED